MKIQVNGQIFHAHGLEESLLLKHPYYPKQYTDSDPIKPYQNSNGIFYRNRTNNPNICMEPQKTLNSLSSFKKEEESRMHHTPDFNFYYKAIILKQHVIGIKTDRSLGQHRESRTQHVWPINLWQRSHIYTLKNGFSLQ